MKNMVEKIGNVGKRNVDVTLLIFIYIRTLRGIQYQEVRKFKLMKHKWVPMSESNGVMWKKHYTNKRKSKFLKEEPIQYKSKILNINESRKGTK